jgi:hypothetical protein
MAFTRSQIREAVEAAGDEHWQALIKHHDVCAAEAERLNQMSLDDLKLVASRVERTDSTVRIVHVFETEPFEGYA